MSKVKTPFYYINPVGAKLDRHESRMVKPDKHPLLATFIASNFTQISEDFDSYRQKKSIFPCYFSKKEIFDLMMQQVGCKGNELLVSYEVPTQPLFKLKPKSDATSNPQQ